MTADGRLKYDVVVIGGTPGGIAAALAAARGGSSVLLVEENAHVGGMSTAGLGKSDIETRSAIGGIFLEFVRRVRDTYLERFGPESGQLKASRDGYYYEPSVALAVFGAMLSEEPRIDVRRRHRLQSARCRENRLCEVVIVDCANGEKTTVTAKAFVDATYEGDLLAAAGAAYRLGREGRAEFDEPHAGVIYHDYESRRILPGSTGEADSRLPAYTFRLCLSTDPANSIPLLDPPEDYDRRVYLPYLDDLATGRLSAPKELKEGWGYYPDHFDTLLRAFSVTEIPGGKTDVNINPRPLAFPFGEENAGYVGGTSVERERIRLRHRNLSLGLLYFLQNDTEVPEAHREMARHYALPADEFTDNGHFPWQCYIREARRLVGETTLTEHDVTIDSNGSPAAVIQDTIALGEFPIDSFPCRKHEPGHNRVLEGYLSMLYRITRPYRIPYRIMIPESVDGLIVPVAASTTHVAFSTIRMEPCWMAMGQAAGTAANLAVRNDEPLRSVPIAVLQETLRRNGQVLDRFEIHPHFSTNTPKGSGSPADSSFPVSRATQIIGRIDTD